MGLWLCSLPTPRQVTSAMRLQCLSSRTKMKKTMPFLTTPISVKCFMKPKDAVRRRGKKRYCKNFSNISTISPMKQMELYIGIGLCERRGEDSFLLLSAKWF